MAARYRTRLRTEGLALAACGGLVTVLLLVTVPEARRLPLNTLGQLVLFAALLAVLGGASVRRALRNAQEMDPGRQGTGEPTPLWLLPVIVVGLTVLLGLPGGWDAGLRVAAGSAIAGLWQAVVAERLVAAEERRSGRAFVRRRGSRLIGGTKLGWLPRPDARSGRVQRPD
jgi:hypothetical protein